MSKKQWSEIRGDHSDIRSYRFAFMQEHKDACEILTTRGGIPLKAVYKSFEYDMNPEGSILDDKVNSSGPSIHRVKLEEGKVLLDGIELKGVRESCLNMEAGQLTTLSLELYVKIES